MADRKFTTFKIDRSGKIVNRLKDAPKIDWYAKFEEREHEKQKQTKSKFSLEQEELLKREKLKLMKMIDLEKATIERRKRLDMEREKRIIEARKREEERRKLEEKNRQFSDDYEDSETESINPELVKYARNIEARLGINSDREESFYGGVIKKAETPETKEELKESGEEKKPNKIAGVSEKSLEEFSEVPRYNEEYEMRIREEELKLQRIREERLLEEQRLKLEEAKREYQGSTVEQERVLAEEKKLEELKEELKEQNQVQEDTPAQVTGDKKYREAVVSLSQGTARKEKQIPKINLEEILDEISPEAEKALHANPFLYTGVYPEIMTIEQFFLPNSYDTFGKLFRSDLRKRKKQRQIKEVFEDWKLEFEKEKTKAMSENDLKLNLTDNIKFPKVRKIHLILYSVLIFIGAFFSFFPGFWGNGIKSASSPFLTHWTNNLVKFYESPLGISFIYIFVITMCIILSYFRFHNVVIRDFEKMMKDTRNFYSTGSQRLQREFKENYDKVLKYYLKNAKKPLRARAYNILAIVPKTSTIDDIDDVTSQAVIKTSIMKAKGKKLKFAKISLVILGYVLISLIYIIIILGMFYNK